MGELSAFAVDDPQLALQLQLFYRNSGQLSACQFRRHGNTRHQGHAVSGGDKEFDGFDGWHLHSDIEWGFMFFEGFQNLHAVRRNDVVGHERLCSELPDAYALRFCQRMTRRNHKRQLVAEDHHRLQQ